MPSILSKNERARLREYLLETLLAGPTKTPRSNAVRNAELLAAGDPDKMLGFSYGDLEPQEVMDAVSALCGCSADLAERDGPGWIDPDRTLDELEAMAARLGLAARRGERVLIATGHPTGPLPMYMAVSRALAEAGCKVLTPNEGVKFGHEHRGRRLRV
ncbi:MAG: phosphatase, partial [Actinomycetota bacterium]